MKKYMWWAQCDGTAELVQVTGQCKNGHFGVRVCNTNIYHLVGADELQLEHPYW
jgi:hypothetical protein